jgi:Fe-S-cluster-containing hydrogenase component 2
MVSFSDGDDPHFRKATFDPRHCPPDCARPCEAICPAAAITFDGPTVGVIEERCYGCGRCLPICPIQQIEAVTQATTVSAIAPTLLHQVDAIEIHTQVGRYDDFMALWSALRPHLSTLQVIAISCPDDESVTDYLWQLYEGLQPLSLPLIWQTDGRPMSGDLGKGTTHATLRYGQKVLQSGLPGYVQLAGGTNAHTVTKIAALRRFGDRRQASPAGDSTATLDSHFGGIAYGSFARRLLAPWLEDLPPWPSPFASVLPSTTQSSIHALETTETFLAQLIPGIHLAHSLVGPLKAALPKRSPASMCSLGPVMGSPTATL